jgi:hypothetical protein
MKRELRTLLLVLFAAAASPAWSCGACVEDKVAATYDHGVVMRATGHHQVVVFAGVEGGGDARALARKLQTAAARSAGVDRDSVRVSPEPAAISFALDPGVATPEKALGAIQKAAAAPGLKLELLRVAR